MIESPLVECRKRPQDGISREQKLAAAEKYFWRALWYMGNIWVFMEQELGLEGLRGAHKPGGAPLGRVPRACGPLVGLLTLILVL